jgi:iron complex outermembrane receptor protein
MMLAMEGNKNLALLTANMLEIGYRGIISPELYLDIEAFDIKSRNYNSLAYNPTYIEYSGSDTILVTPLTPTNLPVTLHQQGITVSLGYQSPRIQIKPFVTFQESRVKNYAPFLNTPDATWPLLNNPRENNIYSGMGTQMEVKSTPNVFGGLTVNYVHRDKFNFNLSSYYYSSQTYYHVSNIVFNDGTRGVDHINDKLILNASISYEVIKGMHLRINAKNLLNNRSREFFKTDEVPFMLLAGFNYEL